MSSWRLHDPEVLARARARSVRAAPMDIPVRAWLGEHPHEHAAMAGAQGDLRGAAACAPELWGPLAAGDVVRSIELVEASRNVASVCVLEAETLFAAGAVRAAFAVLERGHGEGHAPASASLARHSHALGDHARAVEAAAVIPLHSSSAVVRARSALHLGDPHGALQAVAPVLEGVAPVCTPVCAADAAVLGAGALARLGHVQTLERFASAYLDAVSLDTGQLAHAVRVAWIAGMSPSARSLLDALPVEVAVAAQVELCLLEGDAAGAREYAVGTGDPERFSAPAIGLLEGVLVRDEAGAAFFDDPSARIQIWCADDGRFAPWLRAASKSVAQVTFHDLACGMLPADDDLAQLVVADSALLGLVEPDRLHASASRSGGGVHVAHPLCETIGIGMEWPAEETAIIDRWVGSNACVEDAACVVCPARNAARVHAGGQACVAVAPPGDPFWNGVLPERLFDRLRVVRRDGSGWAGAGRRVIDAIRTLGFDPSP